jgi:predicted acetyltransferase
VKSCGFIVKGSASVKSLPVAPARVDYKEQYMAFYEDWINSNEDIVPWAVERDPSDFDKYLDFLYSENNEEKLIHSNWVPHSTNWLLNEDNLIVGAVNIRHRLNQKLLNCGGHIGYGIAPSHRT